MYVFSIFEYKSTFCANLDVSSHFCCHFVSFATWPVRGDIFRLICLFFSCFPMIIRFCLPLFSSNRLKKYCSLTSLYLCTVSPGNLKYCDLYLSRPLSFYSYQMFNASLVFILFLVIRHQVASLLTLCLFSWCSLVVVLSLFYMFLDFPYFYYLFVTCETCILCSALSNTFM